MSEQPTVFLVDDDAAVRDSLKWLLSSVELDVEAYSSANEFLSKWQPDRSGCLLLDLRMPGISGLELQSRLKESGHHIPIIFISGHGDVPTAVNAVRNGAEHFITKPFNEQELIEEVNAALKKDQKRRNDSKRDAEILKLINNLTRREREVLDLVLLGHSNKEIGRELNVSIKTVETHRANMMRKMQAESLAELVGMCVATGSTNAARHYH